MPVRIMYWYGLITIIANWGSKQLAFRVPREAIEAAQAEERAGWVNEDEDADRLVEPPVPPELSQQRRVELAQLTDLAQREAQVWANIPALLSKRTASGYDEGVALLAELRDLAVHQGQRAAFDAYAGSSKSLAQDSSLCSA